MQFLGRYWGSYLKLGFILAIPILVFYGMATFYFIQSALGQDSFEAHAAPAIPSMVQEPKEEVLTDSVEAGQEGVADTEMISETPTPETAPLEQKSVWGSPEGVGPNEYGTENDVMPLSTGFFEPPPLTQGVVVGMLIRNAILPFVFILLLVLYQFVAVLAFARLTVMIERGEYGGAWSVIKWSVGKLGAYIALLFRILFYSFVWVPLLVLVIYTVVNFLTMTGSELIPMNSIVLINYLLGAVGLISPVIVIIRMPRTIFAHFVLADKECSSKEALGHSIEISIGHWWKIVLYTVGMGLISGVVSGVLSTVVGKISVLAGSLVSIVLSVLIAFYMIIFNFGLYRMLGALFVNRQQ